MAPFAADHLYYDKSNIQPFKFDSTTTIGGICAGFLAFSQSPVKPNGVSIVCAIEAPMI